ncbi:hypothetical protein L1887_34414 [Cichorium endivia]|nr:hypothetical protein L1887_34414 [Cichorium endivia]
MPSLMVQTVLIPQPKFRLGILHLRSEAWRFECWCSGFWDSGFNVKIGAIYAPLGPQTIRVFDDGGRKAMDNVDPNFNLGLVQWVWDLLGKGELLSVVDQNTNKEFDKKQVECLMMVSP